MKKVALFDCFSGASGDMILGALVDSGLPLNQLKKVLSKLRLKNVSLRATQESRQGIGGTRVHVEIGRVAKSRHSSGQTRNLGKILKLIRSGSLPQPVRENACQIFRNIAQVEAKIHRTSVNRVHFHEIGAWDSIVDIVGACYGLYAMGIQEIYFTPPAMGSGWTQTEHGKFPVPSPAAVQLLRGIPVRWGGGGHGEWTTPTGAAILAHFGRCVEELPPLVYRAVAYGVGQKNPSSHPNVLRLVVGQIPGKMADGTVWSVQTNLDDMQPQWYGPVMERLFAAGALDVFMIPVQMKKNRPAVILEVLCEDKTLDRISGILLKETTTFGVRMQKIQRRILDRQIRKVKTPLGHVRFKIGKLDGKCIKAVPEFEDCRTLAHKKNLTLSEVYRRLARYAPE